MVAFLRKLLAFCFIVVPASVLAQGQMPNPLSDADVDEIHTLIDYYFHTFSEGDFDAFATVFRVPYSWPFLEPPLLETTDAIVDIYRPVREELIANNPDYEKSIAARVHVIPLWFGGVLAQIHWQRLTKDHEVIGQAGETMFIVKVEDDWKITGMLPLDLREVGSEFEFSHPEAVFMTAE